MSRIESVEDVYLAVNAFRQSRVILSSVDIGVFSAIDAGAETSVDVATACATDPRATDRLMNALVGMGLLEKEDACFRNSEIAARHLVKGKGGYLANIAHLDNLWDFWSGLTESVRGGTAAVREAAGDRDGSWLESFIAAMHHRGLPQAPPDINLIDLHDAARVLDLGGGSGVYAMAMLRVKKELRATVFDLPEVVPITKRYIDDAGMSDRIDTLAGNYLVDDIGTDYDVIFLSAIVHSNAAAENLLLVRKCADALNPGGQLVVQDFIMEEDRVRPPGGAMFALNMLVATQGGDTYTGSEVQQWMEEAGLRDVICRDAPSGTTQIVGWK